MAMEVYTWFSHDQHKNNIVLLSSYPERIN
jgi:hypothetical protein